MDLGALSPRRAADGGAVLHLKDPATGADLFDGDKPVTITLRGADCEALAEKGREIERRRVKGEEISEAQAGAEKLATLVIDWSGIGYGSTDDYPPTFDNVVKLFLDPDTDWIIGQIAPFSRDRRNYLSNRRNA